MLVLIILNSFTIQPSQAQNPPCGFDGLPFCPFFEATKILDNGDSANRVDLVILGDGYTEAEMGKYAQDVDNLLSGSGFRNNKGFFDEEPFTTYKSYFNVHRIDVISNDSGIDRLPGIDDHDTALDAHYYCRIEVGGVIRTGPQRLICLDYDELDYIVKGTLSEDEADVVLVIVNDTMHGGSGDARASVTALHSFAVDTALHELGHTFGLLADEWFSSSAICTPSEPAEENVTTDTNFDSVKWSHWIEPDIRSLGAPTPENQGSKPGLYLGGRYCSNAMYRPTANSKMRDRFRPFEAVNEEILVRRIYEIVNTYDSYAPNATIVPLPDARTFSIEPLQTPEDAMHVTWFVDGKEVATGTSFTLSPFTLNNNEHSLRAEVQDNTQKVRLDDEGLLTDVIEWTIADIGVSPLPFDRFGLEEVISKVRCRNSRTKSIVKLKNLFAPWSCGDNGFTAKPGDNVSVRIDGIAQSSYVGSITGVVLPESFQFSPYVHIRCHNITRDPYSDGSGKKLPTNEPWSCADLGVDIMPGDHVRISFIGYVGIDGSEISSGDVPGFYSPLNYLYCKNRTTQKSISIYDATPPWDCRSNGLEVNSGDKITMFIKGFSEKTIIGDQTGQGILGLSPSLKYVSCFNRSKGETYLKKYNVNDSWSCSDEDIPSGSFIHLRLKGKAQ